VKDNANKANREVEDRQPTVDVPPQDQGARTSSKELWSSLISEENQYEA
jgi:hypothetical protein